MFWIAYYLTAWISHLLESLFQINKKQWQWIIDGKAISIDKKELSGIFKCWASPGDVSPSSFTHCWVHLLGTHLAASLLPWEEEEGAPKHVQLVGESSSSFSLAAWKLRIKRKKFCVQRITQSLSVQYRTVCYEQWEKQNVFLTLKAFWQRAQLEHLAVHGCVCQTASPKPRAAHPGPAHRRKPCFVTQSSVQQKCSCGTCPTADWAARAGLPWTLPSLWSCTRDSCRSASSPDRMMLH